MADYQSSHSGATIDTRVSQVATNTADIAALKSRMNSAESEIDTKADAASVTALSSQVGGVLAKIPSEATTSNKLADKAYVDSSVSGKASQSDLTNLTNRVTAVEANKVDKVGGKGLSTNDYTTAEKNKVASIGNLNDLETEDKSSIVAAINEAATTGSGGGATLTGYVVVDSIDDLPSTGQPTLGYLVGTHLYLYVGTGGDTKGGKYQDAGEFRGPQGVGFQSIASQQDGTMVITLTNGDTITIDLNHNHPQYTKAVLCSSVSEYNAISPKDSTTFYIIPGVALYLGNTLVLEQSGSPAPPEPLPYTLVEYIETDGTAYIDTGISGSIPRSFEMRITPMPVSAEYYFAGVRVSASSRMYPLLIASAKTAGYSFNSDAYSPTSIATSIDNRSPMDVRTHIRSGSQQVGIKQAGQSAYINYSKTATGTFTTSLKIFLFTANNNWSPLTSCAGERLHSVKIYMDSTYTSLAFDGQPCIYNGEYGLWDSVSDTFFGNAAASGAFTGPSPKVYDWSNLTWLLVGDSLTELNYRAKTHYFNYVHDLTGISFVNKGSSGKGYANGDYFYSVFNNLSGINFSFATIFGSGNDIRYEAISSLSSAASWAAALGDINDNGTSTICGYINRALDKFAAVAPSKKIGIVTPTPWKNGSAGNVSLTDEETNTRLRTYSEKLVLIAQARGIPYLDLFNNSGLDPWDADFRVEYYNEDGVQDPGVHPNSEGHRVFLANPFLSFLAQNLV